LLHYTPATDITAGKVSSDIFKMVGLIEDDVFVTRQEPSRHALSTHLKICKEQVVIDHKKLSWRGLASTLIVEALVVMTTTHPEGVLSGALNQFPKSPIRHEGQVVQISVAGHLCPTTHFLKKLTLSWIGVVTCLAQAVFKLSPTQVVATPLQDGHAQIGKQLPKNRHVLVDELLLQMPGVGSNGDPLPVISCPQDTRHEIGEGLASACSSLNNQHRALVLGRCNGLRHLNLTRSRLVSIESGSQTIFPTKDSSDLVTPYLQTPRPLWFDNHVDGIHLIIDNEEPDALLPVVRGERKIWLGRCKHPRGMVVNDDFTAAPHLTKGWHSPTVTAAEHLNLNHLAGVTTATNEKDLIAVGTGNLGRQLGASRRRDIDGNCSAQLGHQRSLTRMSAARAVGSW